MEWGYSLFSAFFVLYKSVFQAKVILGFGLTGHAIILGVTASVLIGSVKAVVVIWVNFSSRISDLGWVSTNADLLCTLLSDIFSPLLSRLLYFDDKSYSCI